MSFDPTLAAIRYGMGLSPDIAAPLSVDDMMDAVSGADHMAAQFPVVNYSEVYPSATDYSDANRAVNDARGTPDEEAANERRTNLRSNARNEVAAQLAARLARATHTSDGFRERLVLFWADHFTVIGTRSQTRHHVSPYIEESIRPHVGGRFADMLIAATTSPMMIFYLDQNQSVGPTSDVASRRNGGINENLARELLELHTLGVDGRYTPADIRELAELLTGLTANRQRGAFFLDGRAEPGLETVLGVTYGGADPSLDHIISVLQDLAVHPATARHLSRKLAVHFIAPEPDAALIDAMAARYIETGGDLLATYEAMLRSDVAWSPSLEKVKQPFEFIAASMRALAVPAAALGDATFRDVSRIIQRPLAVMGQTWQTPVGPDGWSEDEENWITPQGMAGRITWAMQAPQRLLFELPDPRDFVFTALGPTPPDPVIFAAGAAETISDGIGIVLASAAFQRR